MLLQPSEDKVMVAAGVKGCDIKSGAWVKAVCEALGGKGGGKDDFASGAGKDHGQISHALDVANTFVRN